MHYYQFNIGDYASHTRHLTLMENLAYRLLLDLYYLHEKPLNGCVTTIARSIGMRDHVEEVEAILKEFFELVDNFWINSRADREIEKYRAKSEQASRAGKASAERKLNRRSTPVVTDVQPNIKQEPITNNQEQDNTLSALPAKTDPVPSRLNGKTQMVSEVMAYLNLQARRNYHVAAPNGKPTSGALVIAQRLKDGYTVDQCKDVIGEMSNRWMDDAKMEQYLRPSTLFSKTNFEKYLAEAEAQQ